MAAVCCWPRATEEHNSQLANNNVSLHSPLAASTLRRAAMLATHCAPPHRTTQHSATTDDIGRRQATMRHIDLPFPRSGPPHHSLAPPACLPAVLLCVQWPARWRVWCLLRPRVLFASSGGVMRGQ